ncbi:MAG: phosphopantothenoylcysteine decarboxylase, partial [Candidatus Dormibacteria bacterium]
TAAQMLEACLERLPRTRLLVMAAAVADYRLAQPFGQKLHRAEHEALDLHLVPNPDLLKELVARRPEGLRVVGFAAETEDVRGRGQDKLRRKGCDLLVANPVAGPRSAMGGEWAEAVVLYPDGRAVDLPWSPKSLVAGRILDLAAELLSSPGDGSEAS